MDKFVRHEEWVKPWLVQRLNKPHRLPEGQKPTLLAQIGSSLSFGGGLLHGGFSKEGWEFIHQIMEFDYMGASEFEWGAVPEAFIAIIKMAKAHELTSFTMEVERCKYLSRKLEPGENYRLVFKDVTLANGNRRRKAVKVKGPPPGEMAKIHVICRKTQQEEVKTFILKDLESDGFGCDRMKEPTRLRSAVDPVQEWDGRNVGWIELANPFMFFVDDEMFKSMKEIVGFMEKA